MPPAGGVHCKKTLSFSAQTIKRSTTGKLVGVGERVGDGVGVAVGGVTTVGVGGIVGRVVLIGGTGAVGALAIVGCTSTKASGVAVAVAVTAGNGVSVAVAVGVLVGSGVQVAVGKLVVAVACKVKGVGDGVAVGAISPFACDGVGKVRITLVGVPVGVIGTSETTAGAISASFSAAVGGMGIAILPA